MEIQVKREKYIFLPTPFKNNNIIFRSSKNSQIQYNVNCKLLRILYVFMRSFADLALDVKNEEI